MAFIPEVHGNIAWLLDYLKTLHCNVNQNTNKTKRKQKTQLNKKFRKLLIKDIKPIMDDIDFNKYIRQQDAKNTINSNKFAMSTITKYSISIEEKHNISSEELRTN